MLKRFTAWIRWILKLDWVYTGSTIARSPDIVGGDAYFQKNWLNVKTQERRSTFGGWYDEADRYCP